MDKDITIGFLLRRSSVPLTLRTVKKKKVILFGTVKVLAKNIRVNKNAK